MYEELRQVLSQYLTLGIAGLLASLARIGVHKDTVTVFGGIMEVVTGIALSCIIGSIASIWIQDPVVLSGIGGAAALIGYESVSGLLIKASERAGDKIKGGKTND